MINLGIKSASKGPNQLGMLELMKRNDIIEEFEKAIMAVSEDLIKQNELNDDHLKNIGEESFKAGHKRKVLKLFCESEAVRGIILNHQSNSVSGNLVLLKPGIQTDIT